MAYFSFFLILKYLNLILAKIPEPGLNPYSRAFDCGFCLFGRAFDQLFFQKSNSPGGGGPDRGWI
jgi:hypothetical protein